MEGISERGHETKSSHLVIREVDVQMERSAPNKIQIIGSVGSGKSTLARRLSTLLGIPYHELDNVVWKRSDQGDIRNSEEERDAILQEILASDRWIIEGVHYKWVLDGFEQAELIIYLDTGIRKRNYRILKRFLVQRLGLEKGNYKQTFSMLRRMYRWNYDHQHRDKAEIFKILENYRDKLLILNDNTDVEKHIFRT